MARFLFCAPPLTGHANPLVAIAAELERRGHAIAWAGRQSILGQLLPGEARVFAAPEGTPWRLQADDRASRAAGLALLKTYVERFLVPYAGELGVTLDGALEAFSADAIVADEAAVGAGLVARCRGIPWASVSATPRPMSDRRPGLPTSVVRDWLAATIARVECDWALEPTGAILSPRLVLIASTRVLSGYDDPPGHYRFVGSLSRPTAGRETPFPWSDLRDARRVYVSFGTVSAGLGGRFFAELVEAFAGDASVQLVFAAPPELVPSAENVLVRSFVPQLELLPKMQAVVNHGGWNTVCDALANGLPLVLAPITGDEPDIASALSSAGAALRVSMRRAKAPQLREAVLAILEDRSYADAANRLGDELAAAGGPVTAADELERLIEK